MTTSTHAAAAKMIRAELKKHGISATVRSKSYAGGDSITIGLINELPATVAAVKAFAGRFEMGHFDGMRDIYEYSNRNSDLPQVKFVFVQNDLTNEVRQAAWEYVKATWGGMEGAPASFVDAWQHNCRNGNGRDLLTRALSETRGGFWATRKVRV